MPSEWKTKRRVQGLGWKIISYWLEGCICGKRNSSGLGTIADLSNTFSVFFAEGSYIEEIPGTMHNNGWVNILGLLDVCYHGFFYCWRNVGSVNRNWPHCSNIRSMPLHACLFYKLFVQWLASNKSLQNLRQRLLSSQEIHVFLAWSYPFNSLGLFVGSWSPMIFHWLFCIQY